MRKPGDAGQPSEAVLATGFVRLTTGRGEIRSTAVHTASISSAIACACSRADRRVFKTISSSVACRAGLDVAVGTHSELYGRVVGEKRFVKWTSTSCARL